MKALFDRIPDEPFLERNRNSAPALYQALSELQTICISLYHMFEHSANGIYLTDGDGFMRYFNRAYEIQTGLKRADIIGLHVQTLLDRGLVPYSVAQVTLQRKAPVTADLFFELTGRLITISTTPVFNAEHKITAVIGNLTDITALVHAKESSLTGHYIDVAHGKRKFVAELHKNPSMVAVDENMQWLLYYAKKAAKSKATILIVGETGTGKEEMAKFIHENSPRSAAPLLQVNCGAIPEHLIESELFGYVGGAFTGASPKGKAGLFESANGGTIFLDEIGELPFHVQAKLLRVLQQQQLTRVGAVTPISLDVRVISATNRNLRTMIQEKTFREDLYYRLNVVPITIPPLRERKKDILPLGMLFLSNLSQQYNVQFTFSPSAITAMENYNWTGNIRELKNLTERATILCEDYIITADILFWEPSQQGAPTPMPSEWKVSLPNILQRIEFKYIEQYYGHYGNIRDAATALGMDRSTFARKRVAYLKQRKKEESCAPSGKRD